MSNLIKADQEYNLWVKDIKARYQQLFPDVDEKLIGKKVAQALQLQFRICGWLGQLFDRRKFWTSHLYIISECSCLVFSRILYLVVECIFHAKSRCFLKHTFHM